MLSDARAKCALRSPTPPWHQVENYDFKDPAAVSGTALGRASFRSGTAVRSARRDGMGSAG